MQQFEVSYLASSAIFTRGRFSEAFDLILPDEAELMGDDEESRLQMET